MKLHAIGTIAALLVTTWPSDAHALNALFFARGPIGQMNSSDIALARAEIRKALNDGPDGHTHTWSNAQTGASGTITPTRTFTKNSMRCRAVDLTLYANARRDASKWTLCRTENGWRIAS